MEMASLREKDKKKKKKRDKKNNENMTFICSTIFLSLFLSFLCTKLFTF